MATTKTTIASPRELLLPYQRRWADDASRFKIGCMARQTGKDFSSGEEGVRDCLEHELRKDKTTWLIGAPSERQSLESLEKWKEWAMAYGLALADYTETRQNGKSETLLSSAAITFPNGSRVIAVPGRPDTVRGFSANVLLTEFAFFEDPDATWRAILPSVTNPLRGGEKRMRLISTPNGKGNKFYELWSANSRKDGQKTPWSCHRVTIHDAVREGLPVDVEELRAALGDPDGWAQEFECEWLDAASVLLPYETILACENPLATEVAPEGMFKAGQEPLFCGIDFGRRRDLTVCWSVLGGAHLMTVEVLTLQNLPTDQQIEVLRPRLTRAQRVCLDYTGPGVGMGDYLMKEFGEWAPDKHRYGLVELCNFTAGLKVELFGKLRMAFDARRVGVPVSRVVREDLHSMQRVVTPGGLLTYKAPHTVDGHADRCTALALAVRAASMQQGTLTAECLGGSW